MLCNSVAMCETTAVTFGKNLKSIFLAHQKAHTKIDKRKSEDDIWIKRERGSEKSKHQENILDIDMEIAWFN